METYINPEKFIGVYAKLLNVDIATLKEVGELCDPCDLKKEILKISVKDFELLEKSN
jgi:hypothetical protein